MNVVQNDQTSTWFLELNGFKQPGVYYVSSESTLHFAEHWRNLGYHVRPYREVRTVHVVEFEEDESGFTGPNG
jgi:hypothetical protein